MERLNKSDEAYLKGDMVTFWKLQLRQLRSARTQSRNTLKSISVSENKWGETDFTIQMRQELEEAIVTCDRIEKTVLKELGNAG